MKECSTYGKLVYKFLVSQRKILVQPIFFAVSFQQCQDLLNICYQSTIGA